jgi:NADH oxidase (H2O2-forming)
MNVVIVGNGIAGNEVAAVLRQRSSEPIITLLSKEAAPEYDPCSLTYFVGGEVPREVVFRRRLEDYDRSGIQFIPESPAVSIDSKTQFVLTADGTRHHYDRLVLAYGACPYIPPIEGARKAGVFCCKELRDADNLVKHAGTRATVIGSGAVGVEAAEALKKRGYDVTLIELLDWILPTLFDERAGRLLTLALKRHGIRVLTGEKAVLLEGDDSVAGVATDKQRIPCDTVVFGTGMITDLTLPASADLEVNQGIVVNEYMQTSSANIYACGDCAETTDMLSAQRCTHMQKHNAIDQARVVARNILGDGVAYAGSYSFARVHFFETYAATFGRSEQSLDTDRDLEIIERENGSNYLKVLLKEGRIIGAQATGNFADQIGWLMGAAWRRDDIVKLRQAWEHVCRISSSYPWSLRKLGEVLGFPQTENALLPLP